MKHLNFIILTLWLQSFLYPSVGTKIIFYKPSMAWNFFSMFTIWHGYFSLVLMFHGLRIDAPPISTVQSKCIYTFLKPKIRKFDFCSYVLNLVKINISFVFQRMLVPGPIYQPAMPIRYYQFGRFIGQACHNSRMELGVGTNQLTNR